MVLAEPAVSAQQCKLCRNLGAIFLLILVNGFVYGGVYTTPNKSSYTASNNKMLSINNNNTNNIIYLHLVD
jgi:hypothetical protein